jgi:hypothetical protein
METIEHERSEGDSSAEGYSPSFASGSWAAGPAPTRGRKRGKRTKAETPEPAPPPEADEADDDVALFPPKAEAAPSSGEPDLPPAPAMPAPPVTEPKT